MTVIMTKTYRTRGGDKYRMLCDDAPGRYPVVGLTNAGIIRHTAEGRYYAGDDGHHLNLVEVRPYDDFKVDEPVMYTTVEGCNNWEHGHFATVSFGVPYVYAGGRTSWSVDGDLHYPVIDCRRPTEEELAK
jgi:hypothetical protein